jgi:hypothetical protein
MPGCGLKQARRARLAASGGHRGEKLRKELITMGYTEVTHISLKNHLMQSYVTGRAFSYQFLTFTTDTLFVHTALARASTPFYGCQMCTILSK